MVALEFIGGSEMTSMCRNRTPALEMRAGGALFAFFLASSTLFSSQQISMAAEKSVFDTPVKVDKVALPADPDNPDTKRVVNCYRFANFMVKEVDLGEVGADKIALMPKDAACKRDDAGETVIKDDLAGYFLGMKGNFLFLTSSDGWNGGMPFVVFDAKANKKLFDDSFEGKSIKSIKIKDDVLTLRFRRTYTAQCSLYLDGGNCPADIRKATGLGGKIALPDCGTAYEAEKKRTPDYAKDIEKLGSVVSYQAELVYDGKTASVKPLAGATSCRVPD
jgi:hypothetical protein